jgi:hypothetical protein
MEGTSRPRGIFLEVSRKTMKNYNQTSRSPFRKLNTVPSEYEAGVLLT